MRLIDVYDAAPEEAETILWRLLSERTPDMNISHRRMPGIEEHRQFLASRPYAFWYLVDVGETDYVGAVYLTRSREIGVGILKRFHGFEYGKSAVRMLMERHPGRFLANINPRNYKSVAMFMDLGFHQLQVTYERA